MERYSDDELLYLMRCGSCEAEEYLYALYYQRVSRWVLPFCYSPHHDFDREDIIQVAMLNFFYIVDSYRSDKQTSLKTYMKKSIYRRLLNYFKPSKIEEKKSEYQFFSLDNLVSGEDDSLTYEEMIADPHQSYQPDTCLNVKESSTYYIDKISKLASPIEIQVIYYRSHGLCDEEIADKLNISLKSVYNAAYRYHKKLKTIDVRK